jgi:uncharacterized protein YecE (DUF72 family)
MDAIRQPRLWIGPSGWSYPDWHGVVYPLSRPRSFKPLAFVARLFNAVEVNSSFYAIPQPKTTSLWPPQVPERFRFAFKLPRDFTHESVRDPDPQMVERFKEALRPVQESGKLGPVLFQFPWSFHHTPATAERLKRLSEAFLEFDRSIEVRHTSWLRPEALEFLRGVGGFCNIDQPLLRACIPPLQHVFGPTAYVRLHGRNKQNWFADGIPSYERYNYLYNETELREWVGRINAMLAQARDVYVFSNNHYRGQGVLNALELKHMLGEKDLVAPPELLATYPRMAAIARAVPPAADAATLFD